MSENTTCESPPTLAKGTCPTCNKPTTLNHRPFCSKRCADLDLGQWLNESYKIAAREEDID